jgi:ATP-dependent DNA helicase RecG
MSREGQLLDKKSLRSVQGKTVDWNDLVKDCIAFANATGGHLLIGIENDQDEPPAGQRVPMDLPDILWRRLAERTVNVSVLPDVLTAPNGGQYIDLLIPRLISVASTTDGRYFLRVADQSKPVAGDEVLRLASERAALPWETQATLRIPRGEADPVLCERLVAALRAFDRVKPSVKEKTADETLDHYQLAHGAYLTHLGILCLGQQRHRAQLASAPVIQFISSTPWAKR